LFVEEEKLKDAELSEGSTMRDVSMIMDHSIMSEQDFLCDLKRKVNDQIRISNFDMKEPILAEYDVYQSAAALLKGGFTATKLNYSNMKTQNLSL